MHNTLSKLKENLAFIQTDGMPEEVLQSYLWSDEHFEWDIDPVFVTVLNTDTAVAFLENPDTFCNHQQAMFIVNEDTDTPIFGYISIPNDDEDVHVSKIICNRFGAAELVNGLAGCFAETANVSKLSVCLGDYSDEHRRGMVSVSIDYYKETEGLTIH